MYAPEYKDEIITAYPIVRDDNFCGEYKKSDKQYRKDMDLFHRNLEANP
jgi:hypothetical protein